MLAKVMRYDPHTIPSTNLFSWDSKLPTDVDEGFTTLMTLHNLFLHFLSKLLLVPFFADPKLWGLPSCQIKG